MPSLIRTMPIGRFPPSPTYAPVDLQTPPPLFEASHVKSKRRFSHHRTSLEYPKSNKSSTESLVSEKEAMLDVVIESPPLVCYNDPANSAGALMSGQLYLKIGDHSVEFETLTMSLKMISSTRRPVSPNCRDCSVQEEELNKWTFISETTKARKGTHQYPFSYLIPGHLPATTTCSLGSVKYELIASGTLANGHALHKTREIHLARAILGGNDRNSLRIFPPTDLTANLVLPPVIHRGGDFPISLTLNGLVNEENQTRWRIRKVVWRIDEHSNVISPACSAHSAKVGGENKGMKFEDLRTLGCQEIKSGWKTDFSGKGKAEFEFQAGIPAGVVASNDVSPHKATGLTINHNLVIEMVVSEEYVPKHSKLATPTGAARVLRMQFKTVVTERGGLGISWEDECPPTYENVPQSPPTYMASIEEVSDHESVDNFRI